MLQKNTEAATIFFVVVYIRGKNQIKISFKKSNTVYPIILGKKIKPHL
jgi:hypothetical protein